MSPRCDVMRKYLQKLKTKNRVVLCIIQHNMFKYPAHSEKKINKGTKKVITKATKKNVSNNQFHKCFKKLINICKSKLLPNKMTNLKKI